MATILWLRTTTAQFCFRNTLQSALFSPSVCHSTKCEQQQHASKNKRKIAQASAVILGTSLAAIGYIFYRHRINKQTLEVSSQTVYRDRLIDKTGHLVLHSNTWLPEYYFPNENALKEVQNFQVRDGDVLVASFPKSGTTWVQEIVWQILTVGSSDENVNMEQKFLYLEHVYPGIQALKKKQTSRFLKTHLPYHLLPMSVQHGKGKVIYIARNAKDVCVSYYHFTRMLSFLHYKGNFDQFFKNFSIGRVAFGPWNDHVKQFWEHKDGGNILFVTYEDLHKNPHKVIHQISEFLGHKLSNEQLTRIVQCTCFETMKNNPLVNYSWWDDLGLRLKRESQFMREGKVGDWKNYFNDEMEKELETNLLAPLKSINLMFRDK